jgi:hypothetical protein
MVRERKPTPRKSWMRIRVVERVVLLIDTGQWWLSTQLYTNHRP